MAQNGVYAYFSIAFIPIVLGVFSKHDNLIPPLMASITAMVVHFGVYYGLPLLVSKAGLSFGIFTKYLEGTIRNPAIASSTAIIISLIVGVSLHYFQNIRKKV